MAPDIIEAWDLTDDMSDIISLDYHVVYDPREFAAINPSPNIGCHRLEEGDLEQWGRRCSRLRELIMIRV